MSSAVYKYNTVFYFMVRKAVIAILLSFFLFSCSNKKETFTREKEVLSVLKEINQCKEKSFVFLVVRTTHCNLCTNAAKEIFIESQKDVVLLIDFHDSSLIASDNYNKKKMIIKPNIFFESRGIDFGENYLFLIKNNKIVNYSIVNRESKEDVLKLIRDEFN